MNLAHKLITYIIATNRLSLVQLKSNEIIPCFTSNSIQFIVTNLNPEFERKFSIIKKKVILSNLNFIGRIDIPISWKQCRKLVQYIKEWFKDNE